MPKRKTTWSAGERAENRARAEAKKPIAPTAMNAEVILAHVDIDPEHAAAMTRIVQRRARNADDCAELLDALGLREVGG